MASAPGKLRSCLITKCIKMNDSKNDKIIKAGLFGFGTVGEGFYQLVEKYRYRPLKIEKIVVQNPGKQRSIKADIFTTKGRDVLDRSDICLVIEAISDADAAYEIVKTALLSGKDVITANKKMVATHLQSLIKLQQQSGQTLLYEAAVGGAIPLIQTLDGYFGHDSISRLEGVLNGTTNYMLTQIGAGYSYEDALGKAQKLGLAEADATNDVDGWDAKFKLIISVAHALDERLELPDVVNFGIRNVGGDEQQFVHQHQLRIRLKAQALPGHYSVLPHFIASSDYAYNLSGESNYLGVEAEALGTHYLQGPGAGAYPTASAILGDLELYRRGYRYRYPVKKTEENKSVQTRQWYYFRIGNISIPPHIEQKIRSIRVGENVVYLAKIDLQLLQELNPRFVAVLPTTLAEELYAKGTPLTANAT